MAQYFSDTLNVLMNVHNIQEFPYPFAVTDKCLPDDVYELLVKSRPSWELIAKDERGSNKRIDVCAKSALENPQLSKIWQDFIVYHTSRAFYLQILDKFGDYFKEFYPHLNMRELKTSVRFGNKADIYLDCQIGINTPVKERGTVSKPHLDSPLEIWAALLYMKEPDDDAGGDLVLYKCCDRPKYQGRRLADKEAIRPWKTIPYAPNTMACFVNSALSVHGVTEREITAKPRLMVNIILEFKVNDLFRTD